MYVIYISQIKENTSIAGFYRKELIFVQGLHTQY